MDLNTLSGAIPPQMAGFMMGQQHTADLQHKNADTQRLLETVLASQQSRRDAEEDRPYKLSELQDKQKERQYDLAKKDFEAKLRDAQGLDFAMEESRAKLDDLKAKSVKNLGSNLTTIGSMATAIPVGTRKAFAMEHLKKVGAPDSFINAINQAEEDKIPDIFRTIGETAQNNDPQALNKRVLQGLKNTGAENVANIQGDARRDTAEINGEYGNDRANITAAARLQGIGMQQAGANGRNAATLASRERIAEGQNANRMAIAQLKAKVDKAGAAGQIPKAFNTEAGKYAIASIWQELGTPPDFSDPIVVKAAFDRMLAYKDAMSGPAQASHRDLSVLNDPGVEKIIQGLEKQKNKPQVSTVPLSPVSGGTQTPTEAPVGNKEGMTHTAPGTTNIPKGYKVMPEAEAGAYLKQHPEFAKKFDEIYGQGKSGKYLNGK